MLINATATSREFSFKTRKIRSFLRLLTLMAAAEERTEITRLDLGYGAYSLGELRAFLAFSGKRNDAEHAYSWLTFALNPVKHRARQADYSFSDLISLFVVRELLKKGIAPSAIRDAERYLRRKWRTDRPFVSDEISTDGRGIYVEDGLIPGQIESAERHGQQVMRELIKDRLERVTYHDGTAVYWTPMDGVLVDPRVQFGDPVLVGTRLETRVVADAVKQLGAERAATRFRIPPQAVATAVRFESDLALN